MVVEESAGTTTVVVRGAGGPPLLMQPESTGIRTNKLAKTFMITSLSGAQSMAIAQATHT